MKKDNKIYDTTNIVDWFFGELSKYEPINYVELSNEIQKRFKKEVDVADEKDDFWNVD